MATFNRPTLIPTWCADNQTNVAQPTDSLRAVGYVANEPPLAENFNWLFWMLGNWVGYLDQANAATVMATTLDVNTRLVAGGDWNYSAQSYVLSWSQTASLLIPSIDIADNAIAAGSVTLGDGYIAYVQANVPFTTSGSITSGDTHVGSIQYPAAIAVGQAVTGAGIPANTTVTAINDSTLTLSQAATATNATATLTFAGTAALTVQAAQASTFLPNPNTVIIAVVKDDHCYVGANAGQMVLRNGETKTLMGTNGYVATLKANAGVALSANTPVYISSNADARTLGAAYPCDASGANGAMRGQFIGFVSDTYASGASARIVSAGIVSGFTGLTVGAVHYLDPVNVGGITATRPSTVGQYIVPVGFAITSTSLRINPDATRSLAAIQNGQTVNGPLIVKPNAVGAAVQVFSADGSTVNAQISDGGVAQYTSVVSQAGFKTTAHAGDFTTQSSSAGQTLQRVVHNDGSGSPTYMPAYHFMTHPGSIVGVAGTSYHRTAAQIQLPTKIIIINGGTIIASFTTSNTSQQFLQTFPKGSVPFAAGANISVGVQVSSTGNLLDVHATITFEMGA